MLALQNYGGYLCDDTFVNRGTVGTGHGVTDEFQAAYGYAFSSNSTSPGAVWYANMLALFQSLHVVINNRHHRQSAPYEPECVCLTSLPITNILSFF
jgi:hypothetical protein